MDSHCVMCGEYLADASRMICEKCEKTKKTELKPCPFCGGKAKFSLYYGSLKVVCIGCGARTKPRGERGTDKESVFRIVGEAWNRRADNGK